MNRALFLLLAGALSGCTPIPELAWATMGSDMGSGGNGGEMGFQFDFDMRRPPRLDMGGSSDMQFNPAPCPPTPGAVASFCYWPTGMGNQALTTALALSGMTGSCDLSSMSFGVKKAGDTCTASFAPAISAAWGFSATKPIHLSFAYSVKFPIDYAILTVTNPAAAMMELYRVGGISGNLTTVNLFASKGVMFDPGFNLSLGGTATNGSLSFAWISVWQ